MKQLLSPKQLHEYQKECVLHMLYKDDAMLWLGLGLGKTPITLTSMVDRMRAGQVRKTLIFGPLRVIQTVWHREALKWEHTRHLRFSIMHGDIHKRRRALFADADVYLCNYENMNWLAQELAHYYVSQKKPIPFDMVVYDEVSKLKNSTTMRMAGGTRDRIDNHGTEHRIKILGWRRMINLFKYRVGLTGTPASNGYLDLHGQFLAVDGGQRLGEYITHYKDSYFTSDYNGWGFTPTTQGKQLIERQISDITKKMDAKDYLDMPACKVTNILVKLPPKARKAYEEVEREMFTQLDTGSEIELFSKSSVSNKCLQFANGTPYTDLNGNWEALHDAKLAALEDILEEAGGSPVLCSYSFKSDAARIMKKFKSLHPVNMTETPSSQTEKVVNDWNSGKIKLLIGHPACLHPSTKVLTECRGWVSLIDVRRDERVYDGVEFVSHDGCSFSGVSDVIDVMGITLTSNHKLLIDNQWMEAKDVRDCEDTRQKALYCYKGDDQYLSKMLTLQRGISDTASECHETQQRGEGVVPALCQRQIPQHDRHKDMEDMARYEASSQGHDRPQLRRSWDCAMRRMGELREFLQGYVGILRRPSHHRTGECKQRLLQGQLHMGDHARSTSEQAQQSRCDLQRRGNASSRVVPKVRCEQNETDDEAQSRNECRRSSGVCEELPLRKKEKVYDLVNCGPRNRFLIKNEAGEVFTSHNSMGHGIDGLQDSGSIVVWFGINWSLELYEQMNGRIERQGQKQPVSIIRILCANTVDLAVADAIERKFDDQEGLKSALQRYRDGITTNELTVNFF